MRFSLLFPGLLLIGLQCSTQKWPPELSEGTTGVLSPEVALESIVVPPGFRVELVAAEPLVQDPVAMDMDADGRIYAVEMRGWMNDIEGNRALEPIGRIVVLEDIDGDGRMDRSTVFLDSLVLPRAVKALSDGVLVGEPPHLWFARDTDGDLVADEKVAIAEDFGVFKANPESNANGLIWGFDNWIHTTDHERRYRYTDGTWHVDTTLNVGQFGLTMDDYGRMYRTSNSRPILYDYVESRYYARNPNIPGSRGMEESIPEDLQVWPIRTTPGANRGYQENVLREDGTLQTFTAASGAGAYRGETYPREYRENVNVFVPEPVANLVHRYVIQDEEDGRLKARHGQEGTAFVASTDERFRPVNLYSGPDGALYVVDMYRGIIEHRDFQTTYLRQHIEKYGLDEPIGLGRIYRIVHNNAPRRPERPKLTEASTEQLVEHLSHPNGWWRDTAHRLLVERGDASAAPAVRQRAESADDVRVRMHALWVLEGLGALDEALVRQALGDESPHVRSSALRMAEPWLRSGDEAMIEAVSALADDPSPAVRLQLAASIGEAPPEAASPVLAALLRRYPEQPYLIETSISGLHGRERSFLERLLEQVEPAEGADRALRIVASAVVKNGKPAEFDFLFRRAATEGTPQWQRLALLQGVENLLPPARGVVLPLELPARPAALDAALKADDADVRQKAEALAERLTWPGKPGSQDRYAALTPEAKEQYERGRQRYAIQCAACHGDQGQGREALGVALAGSEWVNGAHYNLVRILLHGKEGATGLMPPQHNLTDDDIADILTFVRNAWGNQGYPVSTRNAADVRVETAARQQPWTEPELRAMVH